MGKEVNVLRVSMVCLVLVAVLLLLAVVALGVGSAGYSLQQIIQGPALLLQVLFCRLSCVTLWLILGL